MSDDTLTVDKLRAAADQLAGIKWRVSSAMPNGMILILGDGSMAVSADIDEAVSHAFDLVRALEKLYKERGEQGVVVIDLREAKVAK